MRYYIILCVLFSCLHVSGQVGTKIKGLLISAKTKNPIVGSTVSLKISGSYTLSDQKGNFVVLLKKDEDTLVVSHVGYQPVTMVVNRRSKDLTVSMEVVSSELTDVIVNTGYQTIPKERATGSFAQISNEALNEQIGSNILSRLDGQAAGVLFPKQKLQGGPKSGFLIRGFSTINGSKDPLIILDNFPYEGDINNINPNDIESVTLLKDAAASSIWGVRAGNGVVVITTKSGKRNQPLRIGVNSTFTIKNKPNLSKMNVISSSDYIDVEKELFSKGFYDKYLTDNSSYPAVSPVVEILNKEKNGLISSEDATDLLNKYKTSDFLNQYDQFMYQKAAIQQYALNLQGGTNKTSYFFSAGYDKNINNLKASDERITIRSANTYKPIKNLELSTTLQFTRSTDFTGIPDYGSINVGQWSVPYISIIDQSGRALPVAKQYSNRYTDTAGNGKLLDWNYYPLTDWEHTKTKTSLNDILIDFGIKYEPISWLTASVLYQYERQTTESRHFQDEDSYDTRDLINQFTQISPSGDVKYVVPLGGRLTSFNSTVESHNIRGQLSFNKTISKHSIDAIAGGEIRQATSASLGSSYYGYDDNTLIYSSIDYLNSYPNYINGRYMTIPDVSTLSSGINRYVSIYMDGSYTYDNRYILSFSARRDASNLFGVSTNNKWNPLWSAGIGWNISNEKFYSSELVPFLKFRATYGISGNTDPSRTGILTLRYFKGSYPGYLPVSIINQFPNPDLKWEKVGMFNIGIDFELKKQIITGSIEGYLKRGSNLYGATPFDYTAGLNGLGTIIKNVADMKGQGLELTLNSKNIDRGLKWYTNLLFSYNNSKTAKYYMDSTLQSGSYVGGGTSAVMNPIVGRAFYSIVSYRWGGLTDEGEPQGYLDNKLSTDYFEITQNTPLSELVYKNAIPVYSGNIINRFRWKAFEASFNIAFKLGYYFMKPTINYSGLYSTGAFPGSGDFTKRWQHPGDENFTDVPSMIYPVNNIYRELLYSYSTANILKGDNIRLQYINFSYHFNFRKFKSEGVQTRNAEFYVNIANMGMLWRANKEGIDPDYVGSPIDGKAYTIGLRIHF